MVLSPFKFQFSHFTFYQGLFQFVRIKPLFYEKRVPRHFPRGIPGIAPGKFAKSCCSWHSFLANYTQSNYTLLSNLIFLLLSYSRLIYDLTAPHSIGVSLFPYDCNSISCSICNSRFHVSSSPLSFNSRSAAQLFSL